MNHYNIRVVVPTSSLRCKHYSHPVPVDGVQYWTWRRLEGVEGRQREARWKRRENVRQKFPSCPHFAQSCVCLGLYNENGSEKKPNRGGKKTLL